LLPFIVALMGIALSACGAGGGLPLGKSPFRNEELGYTIRYPEGWQYDGSFEQIIFFESADVLAEGLATAPIVLITGGPVDDMSYLGGATPENSEEIVDAFVKDVPSEFELGKVRDTRMGKEQGACVELSGEEEGRSVAGRVCGLHRGVQGLLMVAYSPVDDWAEFDPTFDAMLRSMTFFEP
jgi:hypothetical protein